MKDCGLTASIRPMQTSPSSLLRKLCATAVVLLVMFLLGCKTAAKNDAADPDKALDVTDQKAGTGDVDIDFLLSMSFEEASAISSSKGEVPGVARITADSVEIIKVGRSGEPQRIRAKGHVYLEMDGGGDIATALSQEAFVTEDEIILRGKPVLKRGAGLIEGLTDLTVFYIFDNQVRAIGRHRIKNGIIAKRSPEQSASILSSMRGGVGIQVPKLPDVGPWRDGPNPLLPPLDDSAVPDDVRAQLRRQAEAEAVLQQSRRSGSELPVEPLQLPPSKPEPAPQQAPAAVPPPPSAPPPPGEEGKPQ